MAKPKKETLAQREAFEFYYGLGRERSIEKVQRRFRISERASNYWSSAFRWQERVAARDSELSARLSEKNKDEILEAKQKQLNITRFALSKAIEQFKNNETAVSAGEVVKLMAHEMRLLGDKAFLDPSISINNPTINIRKEKALIAIFGQMNPEQKEKILSALGRVENGTGETA